MLQVEIIQRPDTTLIRRLVRDLTSDAFSGALRMNAEIITEIFADEGHPSWKPLAEKTQRIRASLGYGSQHPILYRTGSLLKAITKTPIIEIVKVGGGKEMQVGVEDYRFYDLNFGNKSENLPARPMLPAGDDEKRLRLDVLDDIPTKLIDSFDLDSRVV